MDAQTMSRRSEQLSELEPSEFSSKIDDRTYVLKRVNEVIQESIRDGKLEPWEFPQVEHALGVFSASLHGIPVTPVSGYARS